MLQTQNLLTDFLHANKEHDVEDTKMASTDRMEQEDEVLDGTFASNVSDVTRAFSMLNTDILVFLDL